MNKKGFTLVELLAVIIILALLLTITATKGFGIFNNTKGSIKSQNINAIKEAVNVLMTDLENCDDELEDYDELIEYFEGISSVNNCRDLKEKIANSTTGISINIDTFKDDYIKSNSVINIDTDIIISYDLNNDKAILEKFYALHGIYAFVSNNQGKHNTIAQTTITFKTKSTGKLSFKWKVSSETNYDKLFIKLDEATIINGKSGKKSGNYEVALEKNTIYSLVIQYNKDYSDNSYDDTATISNLNITAELDGNMEINNETPYYFTENISY